MGQRGQEVTGQGVTGQVAKIKDVKTFWREYLFSHSEYITSGVVSLKMGLYRISYVMFLNNTDTFL